MSPSVCKTNDPSTSVKYLTAIQLEFRWVLRGISEVFQEPSTRKSPPVHSPTFGEGRWKLKFYANGGDVSTGANDFMSLYLVCESTRQERLSGADGKWEREGLYTIVFEIRNIQKDQSLQSLETRHRFTSVDCDWGWHNFLRRSVYFEDQDIRDQDAFLIICTVTESPPSAVSSSLSRPEQWQILDAVGGLFDDPLYSDVEFVLPTRGRSDGKSTRSIYASRKLLDRIDYFRAMFQSGFVEGLQACTDIHSMESASESKHSKTEARATEDNDSGEREVESIDTEDSDDDDIDGFQTPSTHTPLPSVREASSSTFEHITTLTISDTASTLPVSKQLQVVVPDVAYTTYRAMLYYIYTSTIVFAPLSSSFLSFNVKPSSHVNHNASTSSEAECTTPKPASDTQLESSRNSREQWIAAWQAKNPGKPRPCSAKSIYRLADKLDLPELKDRAQKHITNSLTVDNVIREVFSKFSSTFEDIRKTQVNFFLEHWADIHQSNTMRNVWKEIRKGKHPGYEEVWPLIASKLNFNNEPLE